MSEPEIDGELLFGQRMVEQGLATPQQVQECLRQQAQMAAQGVKPLPTIGQLLFKRGFITSSQLQATIRMAAGRPSAPTRVIPQAAEASAPPPVQKPAPPPDGERFGKYIKTVKIGEGGMGEVWRAWDTELNRWVALKFLFGRNSEEVARFRREAQTAARLNHPNIAAIYEAGENYIAMQVVDGQTLEIYPRNDIRKCVEIIRQAAIAVHYAHEQGIIHRDLKPANIMVERDSAGAERVYLMDFGLAKSTDFPSSVSGSGSAIGTPSYMSPEQARGNRVLDRRTDVYSLGATLYELLAGAPPFEDADVIALLAKVAQQEPTHVRQLRPTVPGELETIVLKCLEKDANRRYATAQNLADDLGKWLSGEPINAVPPSSFYLLRKKLARNPWAWGLAAAIPLLAAAGAAVVLFVLSGARREKIVTEREKNVTEIVRRIERLYDAGDYAPAGTLTQEVLKSFPNHPEARYWNARLSVRRYQASRGVPEARVVRGLVEVIPARPETEEEKRLRREAEESLRGMGALPMAQGLLALWGEHWEDAINAFRLVARDAPGAWEAEFYSGVAHYLTGEYGVAKDLIAKHRTRDPGVTLPVWIRCLLAVGQAREREGEDASGLYLQAQAGCQELGGEGARILESEALIAWGKTEAASGKDPEAKYGRAIELLKGLRDMEANALRGDALLARAQFRASQGGIDPKDPADFLEAVQAYAGADYGPGHLRRAEAYLALWDFTANFGRGRRDDLESAKGEYERALAANPKYVDAVIGLSRVKTDLRVTMTQNLQEILDAYRDEVESLTRLIADHPRYGPAYVARGLLHEVIGVRRRGGGGDPSDSFAAAFSDLAKAIEINGRDSVAYMHRGRGHQNLAMYRMMHGEDPTKEMEAGIADFARMIEINPRDSQGFVDRGLIRHNLGFFRESHGTDPSTDFAAAMDDIKKAIELNPREGRPYVELGRLIQNRVSYWSEHGRGSVKEYEEAIENLTRGIVINRHDAGAYRDRGRARQNLAVFKAERGGDPIPDYEKALEDFGLSIENKPTEADTYVARGAAHQNLAVFRRRRGDDPMPDYKAAIEDFGSAANLNRTYFDAYRGRGMARQNLGFHLAEKGEDPTPVLESALADFSTALEIHPTDYFSFRGRGLAWGNLAGYRMNHGGDAKGGFERAIEDFTKAIQCNASDADSWLQRGESRVFLAKLESDSERRVASAREAIEDLKKSVELNPRFKTEADVYLREAQSIVQP